MRRDVANLKYVFEPKSIAVIGASDNPEKLGNVILKNLVDGGYEGGIYPVNPKHAELLGKKCYGSVENIPGKVDLAIFAIPAPLVAKMAEECGRKGVKAIVVLSAGFGEAGNTELEEKLKRVVLKYGIALIGPNCLGVMNPESRVDSIFFPFYKFGRPGVGGISIITQSGAVGSCIADLAAYYGVGFAKFVSYGNGATIGETELLEYLGADRKTKQIMLYLEGTKDGRKLLSALKKVNPKKPVIVLKAGKGIVGGAAALSHTGNLAGNYTAYQAAFRQAKAIEVDSVVELFYVANMFSQPMPKGNRVGVITDGGGLGVLTVDAIEREGMDIAKLSDVSRQKLRGTLPQKIAIANPLDVIADSGVEIYEKAIEAMLEDKNIDSIVVVVLFQAPAVDSRIVDVLVRASDRRIKPILVIGDGGGYTRQNRKTLDGYGIPTYGSPETAIRALKKFTDYSLFLKNKE
ncbi:MAG: CoA-binding protein [Candidatus Bilamarchaeaceae archaeon]